MPSVPIYGTEVFTYPTTLDTNYIKHHQKEVRTMPKNSKSKRNPKKSRDAVQPSTGEGRISISKAGKPFNEEER